jgi:hypothetical protein
MAKLNNSDCIKKHMEVNGVFLTEECLEMLCSLQENNNSMLIGLRDSLGDILSYFGSEIHIGNEQTAIDVEFKRFIQELSYLRQYLKELRRP